MEELTFLELETVFGPGNASIYCFGSENIVKKYNWDISFVHTTINNYILLLQLYDISNK